MRVKHAYILLGIVSLAFFWRIVFLGEVIYPHANDLELGIPVSKSANESASNRKFSDESSQFIPELHHHLNGDRQGWLSTWNPHVELGRPSTHVGAVSPVFWLTRILSLFSKDAFHVYSWLIVLGMSLATFFAMLLLRAEGLHPAAAFVGATGIGLGIFASYWSTFAIFVFGLTWTLAWLWLIRRLLDDRDPLSALAMVIVVQSLLLSAYPQQIVWHLWFVAIYAFDAAARKRGGLSAHWKSIALIGVCSALGAIAAAPVYLDVAVDALRSARLDTPTEFFLAVLPRLDSPARVFAEALQWFDVSVFGNPMDSAPRIEFNGVSLTPVVALGLFASFAAGGWRRSWPLQGFLIFAFMATTLPPIYAFAVDYLGFSLSRFIPLAGALIPIAVLSARGFDAMLRKEGNSVFLMSAFLGAATVLMIGTRLLTGDVLPAMPVLLMLCVLGSLIGFAWRRNSTWLVAIAVFSVGLTAHPLLLIRPLDTIHKDSPLVQMLRRLTPDGSRFAWVNQFVIPANQESLLQLRSVHSYNSLSSQAYQRWTREISQTGTTLHGRHFPRIEGRAQLSSEKLRRAGIGLLIAPSPLDARIAKPAGRLGRLWFHRVDPGPIPAERATKWHVDADGGVMLVPLSTDSPEILAATSRTDDGFDFDLTPIDSASLLRVSSQFHPSWHAGSAEGKLEMVMVNGIDQGVFLPPGTTHVELRFEPYARWAWIPQACFLVGLPAAVIWSIRRRRMQKP